MPSLGWFEIGSARLGSDSARTVDVLSARHAATLKMSAAFQRSRNANGAFISCHIAKLSGEVTTCDNFGKPLDAPTLRILNANALQHSANRNGKPLPLWMRSVAVLLVFSFLAAMGLAGSEKLHREVHACSGEEHSHAGHESNASHSGSGDASGHDHQCLTTLLVKGQIDSPVAVLQVGAAFGERPEAIWPVRCFVSNLQARLPQGRAPPVS
jgi:hypothetical protein